MGKLGIYLVATEPVEPGDNLGMDRLVRVDLVVAEGAEGAGVAVVEHYRYGRQIVDDAAGLNIGRLGDYDPGLMGHSMVMAVGSPIIASHYVPPLAPAPGHDHPESEAELREAYGR